MLTIAAHAIKFQGSYFVYTMLLGSNSCQIDCTSTHLKMGLVLSHSD